MFFNGGPGDDVLTGGPADDALTGGPGADTLRGEGGDDVVNVSDVALDAKGSPTADQTLSDDRADAGPGRDQLSYFPRSTSVAVRLDDDNPEGGRHERDLASGFEDVEGGSGDDRIFGDAGPNRIDGGFGDDRLAGLDGDDELKGGPGVSDHSILYGGAGDDVLTALGAARLLDGGPGDDVLTEPYDPAPVRCGSGNDVLSAQYEFSRLPLRPDGCERLTFGGLVLAPPARSGAAKTTLRLSCPTAPFQGSCRTAVVVTDARGGRLGVTRRAVAPGHSSTLVVWYERAPPDSGSLRVRVEVTRRRSGGRKATRVGRPFVLQRARA